MTRSSSLHYPLTRDDERPAALETNEAELIGQNQRGDVQAFNRRCQVERKSFVGEAAVAVESANSACRRAVHGGDGAGLHMSGRTSVTIVVLFHR